jgi:uncharacterized protein
MKNTAVLSGISKIVQSYIPDCRIILFGSRARGEHQPDSDYDVLIITAEKLTPSEKIYWSTIIDREIVKVLKVPVDLLLNSEQEVSEKLKLPGHLLRFVIREGIAL